MRTCKIKTTQIVFLTYQPGPNSKVLRHTLGKVGGKTGRVQHHWGTRFRFARVCRLCGGPAVAQWVQIPTAVLLVTMEARDQSPAWHSGLKDPTLPQLQHGEAIAQIQFWAQEPPYAKGAMLGGKI